MQFGPGRITDGRWQVFAADGVVTPDNASEARLCETLGNPEPQMQMVLRGLSGLSPGSRPEYPAARRARRIRSTACAKRATHHALLVEGNHGD
jgi:hypothetical protein